MRYSVLVIALAGAIGLFADTEDQVRRSIPVDSSSRLVLIADWGAIRVQSGARRSAEVEVNFRGNPRSRADFDRMLRDFSLDVSQVGTEIRVNGRFKNGWKLSPFGGLFWGWFSHDICRDSKCLEYTWLRQVEYRVSVPREFNVDLSTSGGSIAVGDLKGEVAARTSGGELNFGRIDGPVRGNTSGGSIALAGGRGKAVLRTSGGEIRVDDVAGEVDASTSGGSIQIQRARGRVSGRRNPRAPSTPSPLSSCSRRTGGVRKAPLGAPLVERRRRPGREQQGGSPGSVGRRQLPEVRAAA